MTEQLGDRLCLEELNNPMFVFGILDVLKTNRCLFLLYLDVCGANAGRSETEVQIL